MNSMEFTLRFQLNEFIFDVGCNEEEFSLSFPAKHIVKNVFGKNFIKCRNKNSIIFFKASNSSFIDCRNVMHIDI